MCQNKTLKMRPYSILVILLTSYILRCESTSNLKPDIVMKKLGNTQIQRTGKSEIYHKLSGKIQMNNALQKLNTHT